MGQNLGEWTKVDKTCTKIAQKLCEWLQFEQDQVKRDQAIPKTLSSLCA